MVAYGRVQNGVVVMANGVRLTEGQEVTVQVVSPAVKISHGVMDIQPVSLGSAINPVNADDDLLSEMLDDRS